MLAKLFILFIALYRKIVGQHRNTCRYYPSCSGYAREAISKYGISALFLALMRIFRCNQLFEGGVDFVP